MSRIALLGTSAVAVPILRSLAQARNVVAVFCNPDRPKGRGRILEAPPTKSVAQELHIPCYQPKEWKSLETQKLWNSLNIDLAIVVSYGYILPKWMLDGCRLGVWNLHFSLLPKWRGASPVNYAILAGDNNTGVSLMRLTPGLDEGPVMAQCVHAINMNDNANDLLTALSQDATKLLLDNIQKLEEGTVISVPQDHAIATWAPKLDKSMSKLKLDHKGIELHRQVRALQPWPGTDLIINDTLLKVCAVGNLRPDQNQPGTIIWDQKSAWLTAGDGTALELVKLQRPGKPVQLASQALQFWGTSGRSLAN